MANEFTDLTNEQLALKALNVLMLQLQFAQFSAGHIISAPAKEIYDEINKRFTTKVKEKVIVELMFPESKTIIKGENMALTLPAGKYVLIVGATFTDVEGNATRVDGDQVIFTSSNPQFAAIEADPEGGPFPALKGHLVGTTQVTGKADAIVGPGEKDLIILETVNTVPGEAVAGTILFSEIKG